MCLVWTLRDGAGGLLVGANRDEWRARPAAPLMDWGKGLWGGRDLAAGGAWMLTRKDGHFAVVTNVREPGVTPGPRSRGELPVRALRGASLPEAFAEIHREAAEYSGFHLLAGSANGLWHYSNRLGSPAEVPSGTFGLSNGTGGRPWPKVADGLGALAGLVSMTDEEALTEAIFSRLADRRRPPDHLLPETGVGVEMERELSSAFIDMPAYGTRCSTVFLVRHGWALLAERVWDPPVVTRTRRWRVTPEA